MNKLDYIDEQLVKFLEEDAGQSSNQLAKRLGVSGPTVRRRLQRLIKNSVIRIMVVSNPMELGLAIAALIAFDVEKDKLGSVLNTLARRNEVRWISTTTGRHDIIALTRFASTDKLSQFIETELSTIDGVRSTETFVCLRIGKSRNLWL